MARSIFFYTDSRELGGAEQALFTLIGELDRRSWAPVLFLDDVADAEPLAEASRSLDVPVERIPPMPLGLRGGLRVPGLARRLRATPPAIFHAHLTWPLAAKWQLSAAVAARVPAVATVHLIPDFELDRSSLTQLRALSGAVGRYIAVSRDIATELTERFRWPASKIEVIYNGIPIERFGAAGAPGLRASLTGAVDRPVVLTCARLDEQKGHSVLLRAAADLPEALFVLAGEGPLQAALERQAESLGIGDRVLFLERRSDVPDLLAACDVFALPSLYEGSSLAVLEAMAARRAVVSTAIGGTDELIEDGKSGLLIPPGDARALAAAVRRLLDDRTLRESIAANARRRVEREFTAEAMAKQVVRVYEDVLAR